jgi:fatty acid desaturase
MSDSSARQILGRFLRSKYASLITHVSLLAVTGLFYGLLLWLPFWLAFVPCVVLAHRVGVLVHEYVHGIPFVRYRYNHAVVTLWDGLMMTFGLFEMARGMHLTHHRWLNMPAPTAGQPNGEDAAYGRGGFGLAATFDAVRYLFSTKDGLRGKKPFVKRRSIVLGFLLSICVVSAWIATGHTYVVWRALIVVAFTLVVPMSLRDTLEHNSEPGDPGFANEYRPLVPMFNVNRHIHHHEEPTLPWYLLEWRTDRPLPPSVYLTHWYRRYVTNELVRMQPMQRSVRGPKRGPDRSPV